MKITPVPTFRADDGRLIQFIKASGVPGFSHRVIIDGHMTPWRLADGFKPSIKAAEFFLIKQDEKQAA